MWCLWKSASEAKKAHSVLVRSNKALLRQKKKLPRTQYAWHAPIHTVMVLIELNPPARTSTPVDPSALETQLPAGAEVEDELDFDMTLDAINRLQLPRGVYNNGSINLDAGFCVLRVFTHPWVFKGHRIGMQGVEQGFAGFSGG